MKFYLYLLSSILLNTFCVSAQTLLWNQKANPANNAINSIGYSADGSKILSGTNCHPASIRLYDVVSGKLDWDFEVGENFMCIMGVSVSSNKKYLAAIEEFGNIFIFDNSGSKPELIDTIQAGTSYGFSIDISPDNTLLAVGCSNGKLKVYHLSDGSLALDLDAHPAWVTAVTFSTDGSKIISGSNDRKVKIWNLTGTLLNTCSGHTGDITGLKVSPNNQYLVTASKDDQIKIWNLSDASLLRNLRGHTNDVMSISISPDGKKIVSGSVDGTHKIWNFSDGNLLATFGIPDSGAVNAVAWLPGGGKIASGNAISDLMLWEIPQSLGLTNNQIEASEIRLYPNPASEYFHLELAQPDQFESLNIIDISGKLRYQSIRFEPKIYLEDMEPGIYQVLIRYQGGLINKKILLN